MDFKKKVDELYQKQKLTLSEKKEFWELIHKVKIKYEYVPKELADKLGVIKARNTPWKLHSNWSGVLISIITFILGIIVWIWWFSFFIFSQSIPLLITNYILWIGCGFWMCFIFLLMEGPHELSHIIIAYLCKIKFNGWGFYRAQPTWDIEYSSYLQSSYNKRAITHLIGTPVNLIQYLTMLIITTWMNPNFWILWIFFILIYVWLIYQGVTQGYGDFPRFYKEIRRKKIHRSQINFNV